MRKFLKSEKTAYFTRSEDPRSSGNYEIKCPVLRITRMCEFTKSNWVTKGVWTPSLCGYCRWRGLNQEYRK